MTPITIHTDGSCDPRTRIGGWTAVLKCNHHQRELSGSADDTTVNAMELTAAIHGLAALKQSRSVVQLFSDSNYLVQGVTEWLPDWIARGWKIARKKPVANRDLWEQLQTLITQHNVTVNWVPREHNTTADRLAQDARRHHGTSGSTETVPQGECHLMIAGSRYATSAMLSYARKVVRRAHAKGYTILVGDNPKGIDMAVVRECRRLKAKIIVAGVGKHPRNGGCWYGSYIKIARDTYRGMGGTLLNRYTVRDRWLVDNAQMGMFIWNGDSPGTKAGHDYMVERGKAAHLVNFGKET